MMKIVSSRDISPASASQIAAEQLIILSVMGYAPFLLRVNEHVLQGLFRAGPFALLGKGHRLLEFTFHLLFDFLFPLAGQNFSLFQDGSEAEQGISFLPLR